MKLKQIFVIAIYFQVVKFPPGHLCKRFWIFPKCVVDPRKGKKQSEAPGNVFCIILYKCACARVCMYVYVYIYIKRERERGEGRKDIFI